MTSQNKVFVINDGGHDYSEAKTFGEVVTLSKGYIGRFHITKMVRSFSLALANSTADDFIVVGGPSTMLAIACTIFATKHGCLNLLIWQPDDEMGGRYICRKTIIPKD